MVDSAGKAKDQQGKVEHHAQLFELMLEDVLADVQPQTEYEWRECLDALQEAKSSLLSVSGVSPMQLVFGRNPEVQGNLLSDNPDLIARQFDAARRRRRTSGEGSDNRKNEVDASFGQTDCLESTGHQTARCTDVPSRRHGCSLAHDKGRWHSWQASTSPMETWNVHGERCEVSVRMHFGSIKTSPEQLRPAAREERHAWRLVEAELRRVLWSPV